MVGGHALVKNSAIAKLQSSKIEDRVFTVNPTAQGGVSMFEHAPVSLLDERRMGTEWVEWWNGLDDGIGRSSRQPVLAVEPPRDPEPLERSSLAPMRSRTGTSRPLGPEALCA
jgi:hypothetical protein